MKDKLTYKEFIGSVHFSSKDDLFFGKIEGINDLVTFEADNVSELRKAFQEAVEDYLQLCELSQKPIRRSFKGSFNVRITAELHQQLYEKAEKLGLPMNRLVQKAIEREVSLR